MNGTQEHFRKYSLQGLLPDDYQLVTNLELFVLTLQNDQKEITEQVLFTDAEQRLIATLLENYPSYAPYEAMYAAYNNISLDRAFEELSYALEHNDWDSAMRNTRNMLSRCRLKVHRMHLDVKNISQTGWQLMPTGRGLR